MQASTLVKLVSSQTNQPSRDLHKTAFCLNFACMCASWSFSWWFGDSWCITKWLFCTALHDEIDNKNAITEWKSRNDDSRLSRLASAACEQLSRYPFPSWRRSPLRAQLNRSQLFTNFEAGIQSPSFCSHSWSSGDLLEFRRINGAR